MVQGTQRGVVVPPGTLQQVELGCIGTLVESVWGAVWRSSREPLETLPTLHVWCPLRESPITVVKSTVGRRFSKFPVTTYFLLFTTNSCITGTNLRLPLDDRLFIYSFPLPFPFPLVPFYPNGWTRRHLFRDKQVGVTRSVPHSTVRQMVFRSGVLAIPRMVSNGTLKGYDSWQVWKRKDWPRVGKVETDFRGLPIPSFSYV